MPYANDIEQQLLERVSGGDEAAFKQLFYQYHHLLGSFVFRITGSREIAADIAQDVFVKIWLKRVELKGVKNFSAYLFVISRNLALNALRALIRERSQIEELQRVQTTASLADESFQEDKFEMIREAVGKLPPQQQKVFILSRYKRMKYDEIARLLNISKETVKSYLQIASSSVIRHVNDRITLLLLLTAARSFL